MKWEGDHKVKEESGACKAEKEEEALCKDKEPVHADGKEDIRNKAACLFDDNASPTCNP